jgi:hypothetical protein
MDPRWWALDGPACFADVVVEDLRGGRNVVLVLPDGAPDGLRDAVGERVRRNELWAWRTYRAASDGADAVAPAEALHRRFAPTQDPGALRNPATLAAAPPLRGLIIWVEGIDAVCWPAWRDFLTRYQHACAGRLEEDRGLFCVPLPCSFGGPVTPDVALSVRRWRDALGRSDLQLYLTRLLAGRPVPALHRQAAISVGTELASGDLQLARELAALELRDLLDPMVFLRDYGVRQGWGEEPAGVHAGQARWVDGREVIHSAVLALKGDQTGLRHRIWRGQVGVVYPFIEEQRIALLPQVQGFLRFPLQTTYGIVHEIEDLEVGQLAHFLRATRLPQRLWRLLLTLTRMRHALAHLEAVPAECLFSPEVLSCCGPPV